MVDYAEELFDSGWQEEAQEIALCLAAFTQANLDNFLRQVMNEEELELSSPLPFTVRHLTYATRFAEGGNR